MPRDIWNNSSVVWFFAFIMTPLAQRQTVLQRPLKNKNCPYCGCLFDGTVVVTKDHVVARRFVPKGKLHQSQNVILRACEPCNVTKSELEDDVSALSMLPDLLGIFTHQDDAISDQAWRKAKDSYSRRTRRPISESGETLSASGSPLPGLTMTATFVSPPQADEARVFELARLQVAGFFFALTYNFEQQLGGFWLGRFYPVMFSLRADWGNSVHHWFMNCVRAWQSRVIGPLADGFYKIAIRRHPSEALWSWALEWNRNIRVIGFFGTDQALAPLLAAMPELEVHSIGRSPDGAEMRLREETPLAEDEDELFNNPDLPDPAA